HIERDAEKFSLLVLPNFGAISDQQVATVRRFVERGGGLIATGESSLSNEWGEPRDDFALTDLFGAHVTRTRQRRDEAPRARRTDDTAHTYLRLTPELRARVYGPKSGTEPVSAGQRHPALRGFDETDILPFGGTLDPLRLDSGTEVLMTFVPTFPI